MNPLDDKLRLGRQRAPQPQVTNWLADEAAYRAHAGDMRLRPVQLEALTAIERVGGLLGSIGVGHGKTLIAALAPLAAERHVGQPVRALLLVPASMREPTLREREKYAADGYIVRDCTVASYARLSQSDGLEWLDQLDPDLVILDEAHRVRDYNAARTRRLDLYVRHTQPLVVAMSGTLTTREVSDYAHLAEWCLGPASPLPLTRSGVMHTDAVISDRGTPTPGNWQWFRGAYGQGDPRNLLRHALERAHGVVLTSESGCEASIVLRTLEPWDYQSPELETLQTLWELPDGTALAEPMHVARHAMHLECGFWYRWKWEKWRGPVDVNEFLAARARWASVVREWCSDHRTEDTPGRLRDSLAAGHPLWSEWLRWEPYDAIPLPPVVTEWVHDRALRWLDEQDTDSVWASSRALQDRIPGCYSVQRHGTGHNLQHHSRALVLDPPSNGAAWEQLIGRLHRSGQQADVVEFSIPGTPTAKKRLQAATRDAKYITQTTGARQRLVFATRTSDDGH